MVLSPGLSTQSMLNKCVTVSRTPHTSFLILPNALIYCPLRGPLVASLCPLWVVSPSFGC